MKTGLDRYQTGIWAEWVASLYLRCKGYRILAIRFKTRYGEIDVIAKRGSVIAFIEVKARASLGDGLYAITPKSQQRILNAAQAYMKRHPSYHNYNWRFDALVVSPRALPYHICDAWRAS